MAAGDNANPQGRGGFQKGKSGNPGGRPKALKEFQAQCRKYTPQALAVMVKLLESKNENVRHKAAEHLLDRGWGKPTAGIEISGPDGQDLPTPTVAVYLPDNGRDEDPE